jgi:uncharacterized protein YndB with AHSA1/START domain
VGPPDVQPWGCPDEEVDVSEERERVEREVVLPVEREQVWRALTEPALLEQWLADEVEVDVREGGEAVFRDAGGEERRGRVAEVVEGERLRLLWSRADEGPAEVTFELLDAVAGTRLVVVETRAAAAPRAAGAVGADRLFALEVLALHLSARVAAIA